MIYNDRFIYILFKFKQDKNNIWELLRIFRMYIRKMLYNIIKISKFKSKFKDN